MAKAEDDAHLGARQTASPCYSPRNDDYDDDDLLYTLYKLHVVLRVALIYILGKKQQTLVVVVSASA